MERQGKQAIVMVAIEPPAAAAEEASCSTSSTPVISEEEEEPLDGAILAEKILEQANELRSMQALQKRIEVLEKRGDQQKIQAKRADKKAGSLAIARLQEKLDKAERRATDYCKRYTTSQFQLKARDKELSRLRAKSEKLEASSEKISKSNELLKGYVSRLESRLQASLDTKDDQQKIKEMSRRLASLSEDNERLQKHLSAQMEDNITMADSLNELRKRLDSDALAIGLESGEVLVELSNTKQICEQLEQKVEQRERDNQLLSEYANELRVKLADPPEPPPRDRTADDLALERRMEEVGRQVGELSATVRAQEEREREPPVASRPSWRSGPMWFPTEGSRLCFHACRETLVRVEFRPCGYGTQKGGFCVCELQRAKVARRTRCTLVSPRDGRTEGSPLRLGMPRSVPQAEEISAREHPPQSKWTCGLQRW